MGDRTYYRLAITSTLDLDTIRDVASAFTHAGWTYNEARDLLKHHTQDGTLNIDIEQRYVGEAREAADDVLKALTDHDRADIPFTVTEDPAYEWLGTMCRYTPDLGMHEVDCDTEAHALLTDATFNTLAAQTSDPADLISKIRDHLGTSWTTPTASA